jgi:cobalt/nickel transport system ATP-binding protein
MSESLLRLKGIAYRYPEESGLVLENIDLTVQAGEKIVLLGANGCGKSTLLKILNGLIFPKQGDYFYRGEQVNQARLKEKAFLSRFRREMVFLFQHPDAMLFNPTVAEEIAFGPRQMGLDHVPERVARWAGALGLEKHLNSPPFRLSGGEKQKVCLAALLALEPEVLLLDEPTANLDPRGTGWLVDFLQSLPLTTVTTTHNLSLAGELGERTLVLAENHRLIYDGPLSTLLDDRDTLLQANLLHIHRHRHHGLEHRHYHTHDWE